MKRHFPFSLLAVALLSLMALPMQAQRISATLNVSSFQIDQANNSSTIIDYSGSSSLGLNLRYYTKNKWAIRAGAGIDNLQYSVGDGVQTDYQARRQDIRGVLGLEKHFMLGPLDIYPGVFVPIVVAGEEDILGSNYQSIQKGDMRAGFGVLMGANIRLLKILRLGVEFDATYDNFKEGVWDGIDQRSFVPVRGINPNVAFTLGIAL